MKISKKNLALLFLFSFAFLNGSCALKNFTNYRVRSFHCLNNNYVFSSWFCDGINDCGDASDESYGCDQSVCGTGNFTCESDSRCLPISVRCNNITDCADGSDEKFCHHEPSTQDCSILKGKFLCEDKLRCVDLNRVCDEEAHCFDGSDEGAKCDDYDYEKCNTCPHVCYRTPKGPYCFYNPDTEEYYQAHKDVNSCPATKNNCDQKCITYRDVNQCSCEENFVPTYTLIQSFYCEEKEKNKNWLLYTVNGAVRGIQGYSNQSQVIKETTKPITAIAAGNEYLYLGRTYENKVVIEKTSLKSSDFGNSIVIVSQNISEVTAIDVDWRTENIYFIDNKQNHIAACKSGGELCVEIHVLDNIATSIALAPREGIMFWSMQDNEYGFVIKRSEMNGQNIYNFVEEGLGNISSIACDEAAEKLYWLDITRRKVEVIRFSGEGRKIFKSDLRIDYLSITINARYLYWNVNNSNINKTNMNVNNPNNIYFSPGTRVVPKAAYNGSEPVLLIYGYSYSEKTTKMARPCDWGCNNGICLIHTRYYNRTGSDCICTNSSDHAANSWCVNNAESFFNYPDDYYPIHLEKPHYAFRIIAIVVSIVFLISAISFYLYRKGCFHGTDLFRHARL